MPPKQRPQGLAAAPRRSGPIKAREGTAHLGVPPPFCSSGWRRGSESSPGEPFGTACQRHAVPRNPCRPLAGQRSAVDLAGSDRMDVGRHCRLYFQPGPELDET